MNDTPTLTLYNSLTRKKEDFKPQDPSRVTMYNCGPTVYSYAHIGNARAAVVADVLFRVLRHIYGEDSVVYARNITDVDDRIIAAAKEQGVPISEITEKYARIYNEDLAALGCLPPTHQPKATEHISHMIEMISKLIADGFAYASDGHVFFDVSKYEDYGKLSGNTLDALRGGDRVGEGEVARKKNAADFVLWKPELDGVGWDAPFGEDGTNMRGRPGWHIECSAMAKATLCNAEYGNVIDIHCGGVDLKFPHHENEKAQSCCANGTENFAKFWVHNEFLNMAKDDGSSEKMSKSLGNVTLVHDLLKEWDGEVIRFALITAKYSSELTWDISSLASCRSILSRLYRMKAQWLNDPDLNSVSMRSEFLVCILADLNIPDGLRALMKLVNSMTTELDQNPENMNEAISLLKEIVKSFNLLGLLQKDPDDWFSGGASDDEKAATDALVAEYDSVRAQAMAAKAAGDKAVMGAMFKRSDELRDQFKEDGIILETGPNGSTWRKA